MKVCRSCIRQFVTAASGYANDEGLAKYDARVGAPSP